ncbi:MAG: hypothetical protein WA125_17550 [Desulfosporosinus sp.]
MKKYSDEIKAFILQNVRGVPASALVELVNKQFGTDFTKLLPYIPLASAVGSVKAR